MKCNFWSAVSAEDPYNLEPIVYGRKTISETSMDTPKGAYTTFRTYNRYKVLRLSRHFDRLEQTCALADFPYTLNRELLKKAIVQVIDHYDEPECRVRVTVDLQDHPGRLYIAVEALKTPNPELYQHGFDTVTTQEHRENPKAKLSAFLSRARNISEKMGHSYEEILMVDDKGYFLEGLSSNFYAIRDGAIYTAEEGVLSGTTRDLVLKIARDLNIPVHTTPYALSDLPQMDEAFVTSTSRSILPIRSINGVPLQTVGPVTSALIQRFLEVLDSETESLLNG